MNLADVSISDGTKIPDNVKLLVIGRDSFRRKLIPALNEFVEKGGVAFFFPQKNWIPYRRELPERDSLHAATKTWIRAPFHPLRQNLSDENFFAWKKDNILTRETFRKPAGSAVPVLDNGGRFGMVWSPLLDIAAGKGTFLMTTLELEKNDPAAFTLLENVVKYAMTRTADTAEKLNVLTQNVKVKNALEKVSVQTSDGIGTTGPILVTPDAVFKSEDLKKALENGRNLWLHGFTPQNIEKLSGILPADFKLEKAPEKIYALAPKHNDPFTDGFACFDFAWYQSMWGMVSNLFKRLFLQRKSEHGSQIRRCTAPEESR